MSICNAKIGWEILILNAVELQIRQNGVILIFLLENIIVVTKVTVTINNKESSYICQIFMFQFDIKYRLKI